MKAFFKSVKMGLLDSARAISIGNVIQIGLLLGTGLFLIDFYNLPSVILEQSSRPVFILVALILFFFFVIQFFKQKTWLLFKIRCANPLDTWLWTAATTMITYLIESALITGQSIYTNCVAYLFVLELLVITYLMKYRYKPNTETANNTLLDLKSIYDGQFNRQQNEPILVSEQDVNYDLLDRCSTVNQLYRSIQYAQTSRGYVISLEGEWGSGKTTILNNTKRLLKQNGLVPSKMIVIDNFDPWLYGNQKSMLVAMLDTLLQSTGLNINLGSMSSEIEELVQAVSDIHPSAQIFLDIFKRKKDDGEQIRELKKKISTYIQSTGKKFVFIIDNLDRTNDENIVFLFKLISIVFDFPGVIYVLSFERDRINDILKRTHDMDSRFTEKIIQQEIKVPPVSDERKNTVYRVCMANILSAYQKDITFDETMIAAIDYIVSNTQNIRTFKRMINSVLPIVFGEETILNQGDLLGIEAIHFYEPEIYKEIKDHPQYLISHDMGLHYFPSLGINSEKIEKETKEYFDKMLKDVNYNCKELLAKMFPYVNCYICGSEIRQRNRYISSEDLEIRRKACICSRKYFDLYFCYGSNLYLERRLQVRNFIRRVNESSRNEERNELIKEQLIKLDGNSQREWIEQLQLNLDDIDQTKASGLAFQFYSIVNLLDDEQAFLTLAANERILIIVYKLLSKCSDIDMNNFLKAIDKDYSHLRIISDLCYWWENDTRMSAKEKERLEILKQKYQQLCQRVIEIEIDLYDDKWYKKNNIWGLYHCFKDTSDVFRKYIKKIITSEHIYRMLWDIEGVSVGSGYHYHIKKENIFSMVEECNIIDKLLRERPPKNEDEVFVKKVYDNWKEKDQSDWIHDGIEVLEQKHFTL